MLHSSSIIIYGYLNISYFLARHVQIFIIQINIHNLLVANQISVTFKPLQRSQEFQRSRDTSRARIEITDLYAYTAYIYIYRSLRVTSGTNIDIETLFSHYTGRRTKHYHGISYYFFADNRSILVANMAKKSEQIGTQTVRHEPARLSNREGTNEDGTKKGEE